MWKKLILWTFYASLVGFLLIGGVNRTSAKLSDSKAFVASQNHLPSISESQEQNRIDHITVEGVATQVDSQAMVVSLENGETFQILLGQRLQVQAGDHIQLVGFQDGSLFEVVQITHRESGQTVVLRDENSLPRRGRGANNH